ncbi:MAG: molybdenum cofactor guanylyltransferase [Melioribacteraceae bacterium]|nr:molybdenum cofactor guanylyltransferase [Melioribacteraceae bacterium]
MGENKALLKIGEKTVIQIIHDCLAKIFENIILISNSPDEYPFLACPIFKDLYPGFGPASGIHAGLINTATEKNFFISCDMPLFNIEMIKYIVEYKTAKNVVLPEWENRIERLFGVYSKNNLPVFEQVFIGNDRNITDKNDKRYKLYSIIEKLNAEILKVDDLPFFRHDMFFNMNDKEELNYVKSVFNK